jgi:hypothetical protein
LAALPGSDVQIPRQFAVCAKSICLAAGSMLRHNHCCHEHHYCCEDERTPGGYPFTEHMSYALTFDFRTSKPSARKVPSPICAKVHFIGGHDVRLCRTFFWLVEAQQKAAAGLRQRRLLCSEVTPWTRADEIVPQND